MKGQQMGVAGQDDDELRTQDAPQDPPNDEPNDPPEGDPQDPLDGGDDDEEVVVQIGDEEPPASEVSERESARFRDLRRRYRELSQENSKLRQKSVPQDHATAAPKLPDKPKLADYEFDEDKYEQARDAWDAKKREVDAFEDTQRQAQEAQSKRAQAVNDHYATSAKALKVKDFQDAEDEVAGTMDQVQQAILKAGARNPGAMVYALGKNAARLQELASIKDPVKFAFAAGELQGKLTVTKRASTKPAPETPLRSTSSAGGSKATLERLEAEADRTGDRTKVIAYKRAQRQSGK